VGRLTPSGIKRMGRKGKSNGKGKGVYCVRGVLSPLLANIYLHELDRFMEDILKANPKRESKKEENARRTKEYRRIESRITLLRKKLKEGSGLGKGEIIKELKELEKKQKETSSLKTRPLKGYIRYADDYLITLQQHSKAEAAEVKEKIEIFLKTHLQLEQSPEKTLITHPSGVVKFLGYNLQSRGGRIKELRLNIPKEAKDGLLREVERLCKLHHINETDLILKVNEKVRGWMNFYRYAAAPQRTFSDTAAKVFWQVCH
jgi:Group II intron, maturase-specific domain